MTVHVVKPGQHLAQLAHDYGLTSWEIIWLDQKNSALRKRRKDPHILAPGDRLFIPTIRKKSAQANTDRLHRFKTKRPMLTLRLDIDDFVRDRKQRPRTVTLKAGTWEAVAGVDADGRIEAQIPSNTTRLTFRVGALNFAILVGHLDPEDTETGQLQRLLNLGYLDPVELDHPDPGVIEASVMEFQRAVGLEPDGSCSGDTLLKLVEIHGS